MVKKYGLYGIGCALLVSTAQAGLLQQLNPQAQQENACIKDLQKLIATEGKLSDDNAKKFDALFTKCKSIKALTLVENAAKNDVDLKQKADAYIHLREAIAQSIINSEIDEYLAQQNSKQNTFIDDINNRVQAQKQQSESKTDNNNAATIIK